jgi:hypothetical protein
MSLSVGQSAFIDIKGISPSVARTPDWKIPPEWKHQRYSVIIKAQFTDHAGIEHYVYERHVGSSVFHYGIAACSHFFETPVPEEA